MTVAQLEKRLKKVEEAVDYLSRRGEPKSPKWYRTHAGRFAGDAVFEEIVRLGREYRESQRPAGGKRAHSR
jgi:hypothetical protein